MFFALRDLRTARGRFALITGVVLLLSVLVAGLLGLTAGLAHQSVSALRALGGGDSTFVLPADEDGAVDLDRASLTGEQLDRVTAADPSAVPWALPASAWTTGPRPAPRPSPWVSAAPWDR